MILAHHVEIDLFEFVHLRPETMPEHIAFALVTLMFVGFASYGLTMALRDGYRWWTSHRGGPLVERTAQ